MQSPCQMGWRWIGPTSCVYYAEGLEGERRKDAQAEARHPTSVMRGPSRLVVAKIRNRREDGKKGMLAREGPLQFSMVCWLGDG